MTVRDKEQVEIRVTDTGSGIDDVAVTLSGPVTVTVGRSPTACLLACLHR